MVRRLKRGRNAAETLAAMQLKRGLNSRVLAESETRAKRGRNAAAIQLGFKRLSRSRNTAGIQQEYSRNAGCAMLVSE
jgi:hypothetical protein